MFCSVDDGKPMKNVKQINGLIRLLFLKDCPKRSLTTADELPCVINYFLIEIAASWRYRKKNCKANWEKNENAFIVIITGVLLDKTVAQGQDFSIQGSAERLFKPRRKHEQHWSDEIQAMGKHM